MPAIRRPESLRISVCRQCRSGSVCERDTARKRIPAVVCASVAREQGFKVREVKTFDDSCTRCLKFDFSVGGWNDRIVEGKLEYVRLVHGNRYEAHASEKLPEATFGTPGDDESVLIRALLNRIFPHPVPWKE